LLFLYLLDSNSNNRLKKEEVIYPLEFKKSARIDKSLVEQFNILKKLNKKIGYGGIICLAPTLLPIKITDNAIPVGFL